MTVGYGEDGALGLGKEGGKQDKNTLQPVTALDGIVVVKASCSLGERHSHTLACTTDGDVYSCGDGYKGKLGHGDQESRDNTDKDRSCCVWGRVCDWCGMWRDPQCSRNEGRERVHMGVWQ